VKIQAIDYQIHLLNMRTRMPFRFGISTMTFTPHLFLTVDFLIDNQRVRGVAADHLPPKWFTKNPSMAIRDEVNDMLRVTRHAADAAKEVPPANSPYAFWKQLYARQAAWIDQQLMPPLLGFFGVTLVERAMLDAFCRAITTPFAKALRNGDLGIDDIDLNDLPKVPLDSVICRHTVGLTDPITTADIPDAERLNDGLPQSLEECIRTYGLTHFKIKLCGDAAKDLDRLGRLRETLDRESPGYHFTLDGNENFHDLDSFAALWNSLTADPALETFLKRLIFVEQPMHRDVALSATVGEALCRWKERPPIIIDESDATLDSLPTAIQCGYIGTSHKNCKGIFKGIINATRIAQLRRSRPETNWIQSGEDLSNVGPISLLQDLAVMANLGITHVERNGHHYFRGLSCLTPDLQSTILKYHPDVYRLHERGYATLNVEHGRIALSSTLAAPFGAAFEFDAGAFTPLEAWSFDMV
jgi:hypothetical protein